MTIVYQQLGRIGDIILQTRTLYEIKKQIPNSRLIVIAGPSNNIIVKNLSFIDDVIIWEKKPFSIFKNLFRLCNINAEIFINPKDHYSKESKYISKLVKAKYKIGFNKACNSNFNIDIIPLLSQVDNYHFAQIGIMAISTFIKEIDLYNFKPILETNNIYDDKYKNKEYIFINISATNKERVWQKEKWLEFIKYLIHNNNNNNNNEIIISATSNEYIDREYIINKISNPKVFISENINLLELFSVVKFSKLVITVDTAIVHIASAFNKRILALYVNKPDFYNKFKPSSDKYISVFSKIDENNIHNVEVSEVIKAFDQIKY